MLRFCSGTNILELFICANQFRRRKASFIVTLLIGPQSTKQEVEILIVGAEAIVRDILREEGLDFPSDAVIELVARDRVGPHHEPAIAELRDGSLRCLQGDISAADGGIAVDKDIGIDILNRHFAFAVLDCTDNADIRTRRIADRTRALDDDFRTATRRRTDHGALVLFKSRSILDQTVIIEDLTTLVLDDHIADLHVKITLVLNIDEVGALGRQAAIALDAVGVDDNIAARYDDIWQRDCRNGPLVGDKAVLRTHKAILNHLAAQSVELCLDESVFIGIRGILGNLVVQFAVTLGQIILDGDAHDCDIFTVVPVCPLIDIDINARDGWIRFIVLELCRSIDGHIKIRMDAGRD